MLLNGSALNARLLNAGVRPAPVAMAGDAPVVWSPELTGTRRRNAWADAPMVGQGDFLATCQRYLVGDLDVVQAADLATAVRRNGTGQGQIGIHASLYYTRVIYFTGSAILEVVAISDVGVVYGEGSGAAHLLSELDGTRAKLGQADAIAAALAQMDASAIRRGATKASSDASLLFAQLDSAHITAGGIQYVNGFSDAVAYLDIVDNGMKRQVLIGSLDLEPLATGFATAKRHGMGDAITDLNVTGAFNVQRRTEGTGIITAHASGEGRVLVPGYGDAVMRLIASMTGYVYKRGGVMEAISTLANELNAVKLKMGQGDAVQELGIFLDGRRVASAQAEAVVILNAVSTASDYNFLGEDDDDEVFFRPASTREFSRPAMIREWRRA